jgi:hypothetical protein
LDAECVVVPLDFAVLHWIGRHFQGHVVQGADDPEGVFEGFGRVDGQLQLLLPFGICQDEERRWLGPGWTLPGSPTFTHVGDATLVLRLPIRKQPTPPRWGRGQCSPPSEVLDLLRDEDFAGCGQSRHRASWRVGSALDTAHLRV